MVAWYMFKSTDKETKSDFMILCVRPHRVPIPLAITIKMDKTGDLFPVKQQTTTIQIPATMAAYMDIREKVRKTTPMFAIKVNK